MATVSPVPAGAEAAHRPAGMLLAWLLGPLVVVAFTVAALAGVGLATGRPLVGGETTMGTQAITLVAALSLGSVALLSIRWGFTGEWERRLGA